MTGKLWTKDGFVPVDQYPLANILPPREDLRDISYSSPFSAEELPRKVDLRKDVFEIEQQGVIGSCVANAIASSCELLANRAEEPVDLSRLFLYNATKDYSGRLGEEGLYLKNAYHVAYKYGMPTEEQYPYDISKDNIKPPEDMYKEALEYRVDRYEMVAKWLRAPETKQVHNIKSALAEGLPVGVGFSVNRGIYSMKGPLRTHNYKPTSKDNIDVGGHMVLIVGYDDDLGGFIAQNSWGEEWGSQGYGLFPYWVVNEPFFEAYVVRSFDGHEVRRDPGVYVERRTDYQLTAQIVPPLSMLGETVDVWMGAYADGKWLVRDTVATLMGGNPIAGDKWYPLSAENPLKPCYTGYELSPLEMGDNHVGIISWYKIPPDAKAKIFVGYGKSADTMFISEPIEL